MNSRSRRPPRETRHAQNNLKIKVTDNNVLLLNIEILFAVVNRIINRE